MLGQKHEKKSSHAPGTAAVAQLGYPTVKKENNKPHQFSPPPPK